MQTKKCSQCQATIPGDSQTCPVCGKEFKVKTSVDHTQAKVDQLDDHSQPDNPFDNAGTKNFKQPKQAPESGLMKFLNRWFQ